MVNSMSHSETFTWVIQVLAILIHHLPPTHANWDPSTNFLLNYRPTDKWIEANKPAVTTPHIQVSECSTNTRLHYPDVQLFAWFETVHKFDKNHGCPYGTCRAYKTHPQPHEVVPAFTDSHLFGWHNTTGYPGTAVRPISNPQTGANGYEDSLTGTFHDGVPKKSTIQLGHDTHYPTFKNLDLKPWPKGAADAFKPTDSTMHPKCGRPCEVNRDPGSKPGAFGGYKPSPASAYKPPKGRIPGPGDTCYGKGNPNQPPSNPKEPKNPDDPDDSKSKKKKGENPDKKKGDNPDKKKGEDPDKKKGDKPDKKKGEDPDKKKGDKPDKKKGEDPDKKKGDKPDKKKGEDPDKEKEEHPEKKKGEDLDKEKEEDPDKKKEEHPEKKKGSGSGDGSGDDDKENKKCKKYCKCLKKCEDKSGNSCGKNCDDEDGKCSQEKCPSKSGSGHSKQASRRSCV